MFFAATPLDDISLSLRTEYHDMGFGGIKVVVEYKVCAAREIMELLEFVAPKMKEQGSAHFSYAIIEDLDDPK